MTETETETTPAAATHPAAGGWRSPRFRPDIEGLRAIAVTLVVLYHAGVPGIGGGYLGVDVFFVISGFLITQLMVREADRTGRLSMLGFYARRARRILPAAAVVLVGVILASYHWLGFLRGDQVARDAIWAALFGSNLRFAGQGVDYLASQAAPSPLQHFWSLAVEEQFYLVWPAALIVLIWLGFRWALPYWLGAAVALSFGYAVWQAGSTWSYFSPATRAWELGAGCLLALAARHLHRIPPRIAMLLAGVGLALIVVAALTFDDRTPFPGYAAALPVLATVLVLAGRGDALLAAAPLQWLGRISYSLYLWHWPVLVIAAEAYGPDLSPLWRAGLVLLSVALATITYVCVENPVRRWRSRPLTVAVAVAVVLIAVPIVVALWMSSASPGGGPEFEPRLGASVSYVQP